MIPTYLYTWSVQKVSGKLELLKKAQSYVDKMLHALRGNLTRYPCKSAILCVNPVGNGTSLSDGMLGVSVAFSYLHDTDSLHEVSDYCEYLEFLKSSFDKTWQSHTWFPTQLPCTHSCLCSYLFSNGTSLSEVVHCAPSACPTMANCVHIICSKCNGKIRKLKNINGKVFRDDR